MWKNLGLTCWILQSDGFTSLLFTILVELDFEPIIISNAEGLLIDDSDSKTLENLTSILPYLSYTGQNS